MRARLEEAEERRKAQSEAKLKVVRETTGLERHNRMRSASATRREAHYSATLGEHLNLDLGLSLKAKLPDGKI